VSIMAIMGIFYAGSAFQNSGAKAAAETLVNHAQQIAAALQMFSLDHDPSTFVPSTLSGVSCVIGATANSLTTGNYLATVPGQSFHGAGGSTFYAGTWTMLPPYCNSSIANNLLLTTFGTDATLIASGWPSSPSVDPTTVCNAVNAMQGISSIPVYTAGSGNFTGPMGQAKFACELRSGTTYLYYFVYRL